MSALLPLLQPAPTARPVVRARFQEMATRLRAVADKVDLTPEQSRVHLLWLDLLAQSSGTAQPSTRWAERLGAQLNSTEPLAPAQTLPLLLAYGRHITDADFVTGHEFLATLHAGRRAFQAAQVALPQAATLAREAFQPTRDHFSRGGRTIDFVAFEAALASWLDVWLRTALAEGPERAALVALSEFGARLPARFQASDAAWHFLLQRLSALSALQSLDVATVLAALQAARPRFKFWNEIAAAWESSPARATADTATLRAATELHVVLEAAPESDAARWLGRQLQPDALLSLWQRLDGSLVEAGRLKLDTGNLSEPARQALANAAAWLQRLAQAELESTKRRADLAAASTADRVALAQEIAAQAELCCGLGLTPASSAKLLWELLVADLGADPAHTRWSASQGAPTLVPGLTLPPLTVASEPVRTLLNELPARVAALTTWSLARNRQLLRAHYVPNAVNFPVPAARAAAREAAEAAIIQLSLAGRLQHQRVAGVAPEVPEATWADISRSLAPNVPPVLATELQRFVTLRPRHQLADHLERSAPEIAAAIARQVQATFPTADLAARVQQDNLLLLRAAVEILRTSDAPLDAALAEWWREELQPFSGALPASFGEAQAAGLRHALATQLGRAELDWVLPALERAVQSATGSESGGAATFDEAAADHLLVDLRRPAARIEPSAADLRLPLLARLEALGGDTPALADAFSVWFSDATAALTRAPHPTSAVTALRLSLARFAGAVGPARAAQTLALLAAQTSRHLPSPRPDTPWPAWRALAALSLQSLEQDLLAAALQSSWVERTTTPAPTGVAEPTLALLHPFLVRQMRQHDLELAAANTARFLFEQITPALAFPADAWRQIFAGWHQAQLGSCPAPARALLQEWHTLFTELAPTLARNHVLALHSFSADARYVGPDLSTERTARHALGLVLLDEDKGAAGRLARSALAAVGWRHLPAEVDAVEARLAAHADRLTVQLDRDELAELQQRIANACLRARTARLATKTAPTPSALTRALVEAVTPAPSRSLFGRLRGGGGRPSELALEFARAELALQLVAEHGSLSPAAIDAIIAFTTSQLPADLVDTLPAARTALRETLGTAVPAASR